MISNEKLFEYSLSKDFTLKSDRLVFRSVQIEHCNEVYLSWLNDLNIYKWLEIDSYGKTMDGLLKYVKSQQTNPTVFFWAIHHSEDGRHIGNIKLGPINFRHEFADLSYFIGDSQYWNQGYATEAIRTVCKFAFNTLELHRVQASCLEDNNPSKKALLKSGFSLDGVLHLRNKDIDSQWKNLHWYALMS